MDVHVSYLFQSLHRTETLAYHEVGQYARGGAGLAKQAVDEDDILGFIEGIVDEGGDFNEVTGNIWNE